MHTALALDDATLLGSDDPTGDDGPKLGVGVAYSGPDDATTMRVFDQLAEGGEVPMPLRPLAGPRVSAPAAAA